MIYDKVKFQQWLTQAAADCLKSFGLGYLIKCILSLTISFRRGLHQQPNKLLKASFLHKDTLGFGLFSAGYTGAFKLVDGLLKAYKQKESKVLSAVLAVATAGISLKFSYRYEIVKYTITRALAAIYDSLVEKGYIPPYAILLLLVRELTARERIPRVTEPDLVMDDPKNVAAFVEAGREHAVMAPVYLFHCANICEVIRPGDTVVDLACGPANQLAMVARLNPDIQFIGMDLSEPMLESARQLIANQGLKNVQFRHGDITDLSFFAGKSVDAFMSTMALHHLSTTDLLCRTYAEVARVLKDDGGVYMVDFGHLKSKHSIDYFAYQYADRQPALFTEDYFNSLHAAFYPEDFQKATKVLEGRARLYSTAGVRFMMAFKSAPRRRDAPELAIKLALMKDNLPEWHKVDFNNLMWHFRKGGMACLLLS